MTLTLFVATIAGLWIGAFLGQKKPNPWRWRLSGAAVGVLLACGGLIIEHELALAAPRCYYCGSLLNPAAEKPFRCPYCGVLDPLYRGTAEEDKRTAKNAAAVTDLLKENMRQGMPVKEALEDAGRRVPFGK